VTVTVPTPQRKTHAKPLDDIRIPDEIRPVDGRFGSGPSKVRPEGVEALSAVSRTFMGTSHRQRTVKDQVARLRRGLAEFFALPDGYEVILANGGTSAFWEVAAFGLVRDKAQFATFGEFGAKFVKAVADAPFLAAPTVHEAPGGQAVPVRRVAGADPGALMVIDATSGGGSLDVDVRETDVYYLAPQKALGSDGGIWLALMSPAAIERAYEIKGSGRYIPQFLDLVTAIEQSRLEQTYNTPALATVFLAAEQVDWMNAQGGLAWAVKRSAESAAAIYGWADRSSFATPFVTDPALRSAAVATIDFAEPVDAAEVARVLRANGVVDTEPYRKLGRNQLRIALYPTVDPSDVTALTQCIDYIVDRL
jgi:phosphoserine aminotransferase